MTIFMRIGDKSPRSIAPDRQAETHENVTPLTEGARQARELGRNQGKHPPDIFRNVGRAVPC